MADARPQPDGSDRRAVTAADVPAVARVLTSAFRDNPGFSWVYPDPGSRPGKIERGFADYLRAIWLPGGECITTHSLDGAALWLPPGAWHVPLSVQLRLLPRTLATARGDFLRLMRYLSLIERKHPREPHWYLAVLGIGPGSQGRGFGSHLMAPVLQRCDAEGLPAYLETDTERAKATYERNGFEATERFDLPGGGPPIWLMWRDPV